MPVVSNVPVVSNEPVSSENVVVHDIAVSTLDQSIFSEEGSNSQSADESVLDSDIIVRLKVSQARMLLSCTNH